MEKEKKTCARPLVKSYQEKKKMKKIRVWQIDSFFVANYMKLPLSSPPPLSVYIASNLPPA